jgi:hypothetical protein
MRSYATYLWHPAEGIVTIGTTRPVLFQNVPMHGHGVHLPWDAGPNTANVMA